MIDRTLKICIIHTHATVAQLVEQRTENPCVISSILIGGSSPIPGKPGIGLFLWHNVRFPVFLRTFA
jgi:hypothetical protein